MTKSDMGNYFLIAISCLPLLHVGVRAEKCNTTVVAERDIFHVPEGVSLSLSCVVQHCGDSWTGHWMWTNSTYEFVKFVKESVRHHFTNMTLSANKAQLILTFRNVNQSDEGFYGCRVVWGQGDIEQGHYMYVNITAAVPSKRSVLHKALVCATAFLCLPILLGLAHCLSSKVKPQPFPRTLSTHRSLQRDQPHPAPQPPPRCPVPQKLSTSPRKAPPKSQQKADVVYADISQGALGQQGAPREPAQSTVYSSLRFS
uniref:uncharacterized protein si:dkey-52l18.4 n=1 Tax=Scatophagus argus TaxID=75038 RepID=UPI001ED80C24|nr:uncharacterized protein si:dkey-52l18.4 [Scatophagus argus]